MAELADLECVAGRILQRPDSYRGLNWQDPCEWPVVEIFRLPPENIKVALCKEHLDVILDDLYDVMVNRPGAIQFPCGTVVDWKPVGNPRLN